MALRFDFNKCLSEVKKVSVSPKGWRGPIEIEYAVAQVGKFDTFTSIVWRIAGTTFTFTENEPTFNKYAKSNYVKHFTDTLEGFREDYLSWWEDERYNQCEWRDEYEKEFGRLIIGNTNN